LEDLKVSTPRITTALARNTDPASSHEAAERAESFRECHYRRILAALVGGSMTSPEIAQRCGLDQIQVSRRLPEMEREGLVARAGIALCGIKRVRMTWWVAA